jgi:hypothetical protein
MKFAPPKKLAKLKAALQGNKLVNRGKAFPHATQRGPDKPWA